MAYAAISANSTAIFTNSNGCFSQTQKKPDNNHNISFLNASSSNFPRLSHTLLSSSQRYNPSRPIYINAASTVDLSSSVLAKEPGGDLKPNTGPKQTRPTILVSEKLGEAGLRVLREFAEVDCLYELSQEELCANISSYDALIVRSGTKVGRAVFEAAQGKLKVVGRAGVGIDNVDLQAATELGCLVVNAPTANTVAAAEHGIALLTSMARNVAQADASMKAARPT